MEIDEFTKILLENGFVYLDYLNDFVYEYDELVSLRQNGLKIIFDQITIKEGGIILQKESNYHINTVGYLDISLIKSLRFEPTMTGKIMVIEWGVK
jgi:hypothetical protein